MVYRQDGHLYARYCELLLQKYITVTNLVVGVVRLGSEHQECGVGTVPVWHAPRRLGARYRLSSGESKTANPVSADFAEVDSNNRRLTRRLTQMSDAAEQNDRRQPA